MRPYLLIWVFFTLIFVNCDESGFQISEGIIEYKIHYLDDAREKPIINILPTTMTFSFKDDNTLGVIEDFMGFFSISNIINIDLGKSFTLVKIGTKKYIYEGELGKQNFAYEEMKNIKINFVNQTKEIAGYICNKAIGSCAAFDYEPMFLYYTYDIAIETPNISTAFEDIDGVLLDFQLRLNTFNMRMTADKVKRTKISEKKFLPPEKGYTKVSAEELQELMSDFIMP